MAPERLPEAPPEPSSTLDAPSDALVPTLFAQLIALWTLPPALFATDTTLLSAESSTLDAPSDALLIALSRPSIAPLTAPDRPLETPMMLPATEL